jgi:large subunit ribosomal protein L31e
MAKEEKTRVEELEREFVVPLRASQHAPPEQERAAHALKTVRRFIMRHMKGKAENVWIDPRLNEYLWTRSRGHIPPRVRVKAIRFEDGLVEVDLAEEST